MNDTRFAWLRRSARPADAESGSAQPRHPFVEMTITRLLILVREPEMIFWVFIFPLLMALALGIAFRSPSEAPVAVAVEPGAGAAALADALAAHDSVEVVAVAPGATATTLRDGLAHVVVVPGDPPAYRYDPARPESRLARQTVDDLLQRAAGRRDVWTGRDEAVAVPGSRYIDWLIPGLLGMNIMGTGMWGIGFTLVVQRSRKLLKRLIATPMRRHQYLAALVTARLVLLGLELVVLVGFARLLFGVPIEGSPGALAAVSLLGAMTFGGLGLLTASRAQTVEGVSGIMNVVMAPMWICSGVFFAASNFPDAMQPFIQALPLTALIDALRNVMLDGEGLIATGPELLVLAAWGGASFGVALRIFRWR